MEEAKVCVSDGTVEAAQMVRWKQAEVSDV